MYELIGMDRLLLLNSVNGLHELSVRCVIESKSPGEVYVDHKTEPHSYLIKTSECNLIGGDSTNQRFLEEVKEKIDYFDSLMCESEGWLNEAKKLHPNIGLKAFVRKFYSRNSAIDVSACENIGGIEYVYYDDLAEIAYANKEILLDWVKFIDVQEVRNICLAAIVVVDDCIVSCACVDCFVGGVAEIGIKTIPEKRKNGYGVRATSSLIRKLNEDGVFDINWHCISTNSGSKAIAKKCGFVEIGEHPILFPFPPIENISDLLVEEWSELGDYYSKLGVKSPDQFWQAARCWAKANDIHHAVDCINALIDNDQLWFLDHMSECCEFSAFSNDDQWISTISSAKNRVTP